MFIITRQAFRFKAEGKQDVVVAASREPVLVPDHVAEDPIFGWAVKDGTITKVDAEPVAPAPVPNAPAPRAKGIGKGAASKTGAASAPPAQEPKDSEPPATPAQ